MSRLDELIQELCPNGVEYKLIGDCVHKTSNIRWATADGSYIYIDLTSVDRDTHKITETQTIDADYAPSRAEQIVCVGDVLFATTSPTLKRYCLIDEEYDGQICSTGFCVLRAKESLVLPRWLFHVVSSSEFYYYVEANQKGASYPAISDKEVKKYKMPVPPLPVQREIVRILDNFTELTAELITELTAELIARQKQYEYYRDLLLTFGDADKTDKQTRITELRKAVKWFTIESLCEISRGKVISKDFIRDHPGEYPVYSSQTENNGVLGLISEYAYDGEYLTWTTDGANAGTVFYRTGRFNITNVCGLLKPKSEEINIRYLFFILGITADKYVSRGMGNPKLMSNVMGHIKIPVPPIGEQERIVSILNRFDALCNDLTSGLPAEIESRQKQYEYYRDKLLTFKESV